MPGGTKLREHSEEEVKDIIAKASAATGGGGWRPAWRVTAFLCVRV
jgi:hypothetical protein